MDVTQMVQELWDRDRIKALPVTYARGVDRRDWDLVRSCFTDDCFVEGSRAAAPIGEYLADLIPGVEHFPTTMHFMGNQLVEVSGDEGQVETYAVAFHWAAEQAGADDPANLVVGVRYHDSVVRTGAGWLIARRHVDPDWRSGPYPG
jgi:3-phenylpropionate/cinnamic acid dioxygenase small subunit